MNSSAQVYDMVTDRILAALERGVIPWRRPWSDGPAAAPANLVTRRRYRGVNVFLLACQGFRSPFWVTFKQARDLGGHVRKGEKGTPIVFWRWLDRETAVEPGAAPTRERFPLLRTYVVFNVEQCDGLTVPPAPLAAAADPIAAGEAIAAGMPQPPTLRFAGARAFYRAVDDLVQLPARTSFERGEAFYGTLFHELVHATGHASRVGRPSVGTSAFGSAPYAQEELVAEMGAAFLLAQAGLADGRAINHSAAYIEGWLQALRNDRRMVALAAQQAQRAADFILGAAAQPAPAEAHERALTIARAA